MRIPWYLGAPGFLTVVIVAAFVANYLGADYFKRTHLQEANPFAVVGTQGDAPSAVEVASGQFKGADSNHRGSGTAKVLRAEDGSLTLRLENFSVTNGPDLFVVLSTGSGYSANGAINLGRLKATDGNLNYAIPAGADISKFESAVIWCQQFNVTFAAAAFAPPTGPTSMATASPSAAVAAPAVATPANATPAPLATAIAPTATAPLPTSTVVAPATSKAPSGAVVVSFGKFRDGEPGHRGSGTARLGRDASGKPVLVFEGFSVTNGPDLHVILGMSASGGGEGLDLGKLKATDGTFTYAIPDGADLAQFRSVTIWCASFPTIFAVAELAAP